MSVVHAEMESFLGKFSLLATYGVDANLTFSSSGGKVSVDLKADLGYLKACNLPRNRPINLLVFVEDNVVRLQGL